MKSNQALKDAFMPKHDDAYHSLTENEKISQMFANLAAWYKNAGGMMWTCQTEEQAWNAWWTADIMNNKDAIVRNGGNYDACLGDVKGSFMTYANMGMAYMALDKAALTTAYTNAYEFESKAMKDCTGTGYPAKANFDNFGKCMATWADLTVIDAMGKNAFCTALMGGKPVDWAMWRKGVDEAMNDIAT